MFLLDEPNLVLANPKRPMKTSLVLICTDPNIQPLILPLKHSLQSYRGFNPIPLMLPHAVVNDLESDSLDEENGAVVQLLIVLRVAAPLVELATCPAQKILTYRRPT